MRRNPEGEEAWAALKGVLGGNRPATDKRALRYSGVLPVSDAKGRCLDMEK